MPHQPSQRLQNSTRKNSSDQGATLITLGKVIPCGGEIVSREGDTLRWWIEQYFRYQVTTSEASQKAKRRDLNQFLAFVEHEEGCCDCLCWTPRLSRAFRDHLRKELNEDGSRRWSDRTINRMLATLKTFSKWVHKLAPFTLGDPMEGLKNLRAAQRLEVDRALTKGERRRLLDTADALPVIGRRSKDRYRHSKKTPLERPQHKSYRPLRNRAIMYTLIETGMRRAAVVGLEVDDVDFKRGQVTAVEKGGDGGVGDTVLLTSAMV
jgi:site-specific recombinase XerD